MAAKKKKTEPVVEEKIIDSKYTNIIIYSGGYDSTLVIHELLKSYPKTQFVIVGFNVNY